MIVHRPAISPRNALGCVITAALWSLAPMPQIAPTAFLSRIKHLPELVGDWLRAAVNRWNKDSAMDDTSSADDPATVTVNLATVDGVPLVTTTGEPMTARLPLSSVNPGGERQEVKSK